MKSLWLCLVLLLAATLPLLAQSNESCSGSLPTRLSVGQRATVAGVNPLALRQQPDGTRELTRVPEGAVVLLLDGPSCGSIRQFTWWYVQYGEEYLGWIAEANAVEYWLEPDVEVTPEPELIDDRGELLADRLVEGSVEPHSTDVWSFEAEEGEILVFSAPPVDVLPLLKFYDSAGDIVDAGEMIGWAIDISLQQMFVAPKTDHFTVHVSTYVDYDMSYQLKLERLQLQENHILSVDSTVYGRLVGESTLETFEVWALDGTKDAVAVLTATLDEAESSDGLSILLMDAQGLPMLFGAETATRGQSELGFVMDDQRYYLIVRGNPSEVPDYTLSMALGTQDDLRGISFAEFNLGMACPYVYTRQGDGWAYDTTILYGLVGADSKAVQLRPLTHFDGHLLIREVEPETSHIDSLHVYVTDAEGQIHRLGAANTALEAGDNDELVLRQGDEIELTFAGFAEIANPISSVIVAEGYYVPY